MSKINISSLIQEMKEYQESNGNKSKIVANSLNRVIEIQHLLDNKFSLALITDKGMGKTSIINYALGLEYERKKKLKNGREVIVYQDVLETGAGATTTSETEIIQSLNNYSEIEIIPNTKEEMDELLKEFAKYIFKEVYKDFDGHVSIPSELLRAMRNMTGLKDIEDENGKK